MPITHSRKGSGKVEATLHRLERTTLTFAETTETVAPYQSSSRSVHGGISLDENPGTSLKPVRLCRHCTRPALPGLTRCQHCHLTHLRVYEPRRRRAAYLRGRCSRCPAPRLDGYIRCAACLLKDRLRVRKSTRPGHGARYTDAQLARMDRGRMARGSQMTT